MMPDPKRDARILAMLRRGFAPKEVAFRMKLASVAVVYEVLRKNSMKAYNLRRRNAC